MLGRTGSLTAMLSHECQGTTEDTHCYMCLFPITIGSKWKCFLSSTPDWKNFAGNNDHPPTQHTSIQMVHVNGECDVWMKDQQATEHAKRFVWPERHQTVIQSIADPIKLQQHPSLVHRFADDNDLNPRIESSYLTSPLEDCVSYSITVDPADHAFAVSFRRSDEEKNGNGFDHTEDEYEATNRVLLRALPYHCDEMTQFEAVCYQSGMLIFDLGDMELSRFTGLSTVCQIPNKDKKQWSSLFHNVVGWFHLGNEPSLVSPSAPMCHAHLVLVFRVFESIDSGIDGCMTWNTWLKRIDQHEQQYKKPAVRFLDTFIRQAFAAQVRTQGVYTRFATNISIHESVGYRVNQQETDSAYTYFINKRVFWNPPTSADIMIYQQAPNTDKTKHVIMPIVYEQDKDIQVELKLQSTLISVTNTMPAAISLYSNVPKK